MQKIEQTMPYIHNIHIDDSVIEEHEDDKFPYHFSRNVNVAFADKWKEVDQNDNP